MKFENMPNNNEKTPEKTKIPEKSQNLEILDNFKNMQKLLSENLISSNLNNNIFQQQSSQIQVPEETPTNNDFKERFSNFYDSIEPSTSKLKKILMTSKPQEPINLTNYRKHTAVPSLESPGALVGGDTEKDFQDNSVCDRILNVTPNSESPAKIVENPGSTKETPSKTAAVNLDSTISGSLSSLSSPNVSGTGIDPPPIVEPEMEPENFTEPSKEIIPGPLVQSPVNMAPIWNEGAAVTTVPSTVQISSSKKVVPGTYFPPFLSPSPAAPQNTIKHKENVTSTLKSRLPIANYNASPIKTSLSAKNPEIAGILASTLSAPQNTSNFVGVQHQSTVSALSPNITAILTANSKPPSTGNFAFESTSVGPVIPTNPLGTFGLGPRPNPPIFSATNVSPGRFVAGNIVGGSFVPEGLMAKEMFDKPSNSVSISPSLNSTRSSGPLVLPPPFLTPGLGTNIVNTSSIVQGNVPVDPQLPAPFSKFAKSTIEPAKTSLDTTKSPAKAPKDKGKLFLCTECNNAFSKSHLFNHMKTVHNKFTCLFCYGFFVSVESLEKHLVKKHKVSGIQFSDDESFKKYLLDSCVLNSDKMKSKQISVPVRKTLRAVCCKCGDVLNSSDLERHVCAGDEENSSEMAFEDSRIDEPMDLEIPMDIDETIGVPHFSLPVQEPGLLKLAEPSVQGPNFNGSVLKHIQNSVDNYLNQQKMNSSQNEEQEVVGDSWRVECEPESEDKLIVPKLKVKIPKFYHNQNFYDKIESEEDSGDEDSGSEDGSDLDSSKEEKHLNMEKRKSFEADEASSESEDEEELEINKRKAEILEKMREIQNKMKKKEKRKKDKDKEHEEIKKPAEVPENPPLPPLSLKIKIRNITSNNMEAFVENLTPALEETVNEPEPVPEPMDLEPPQEPTQIPQDFPGIPEELPNVLMAGEEGKEEISHFEQRLEGPVPEPVQNEPEPEPEPKEPEVIEAKPRTIMVDDQEISPAGDEAMIYNLALDKGLDDIPMREFLKICLKTTFPFCLYCNHARKIVVNGKSLAVHFIQFHRFQAKVEDVDLPPDTMLTKLEQSLPELDTCYFNLDTYDNFDQDKTEGHITISHDKLYECFQCRFQTHSHKELYLHNRKMHQKTLIVCLMCKINFYSYSELLCHICPGQPHKQQFLDYKFYCCLCNMDNIPSAFRLMVHLRKKHYACDVCLEKCNDQGKLSNHVWKHKLHHLCYRCGISYRNKADIMKHLFWKHGTEGITCKKCLQKKWPHVYHFCIPPTAFTCEVCDLQFTKALSLKVHRRLHENNEKYPCTEDNCDQKFISRKLLLKHVNRYHFIPAEDEFVQPIKEDKSNSNIVIPVIPESQCCRTMPIQFKDQLKKILPLNVEKPVEVPEIPEPVEKEKEKHSKKSKKNKTKEKSGNVDKDGKEIELPDLPEMRLNLSESDSSDNEDSRQDDSDLKTIPMEVEEEKKKETLVKASNLSDSEDSESEKPDQEVGKENPEKSVEKIEEKPTKEEGKVEEQKEPSEKLEAPEKMETSENKTEEEKDFAFEPKENLEPMQNIWENFKNFQEQQAKESKDTLMDSDTEEGYVRFMLENAELHVVQSDHDYAKMYRPEGELETKDEIKEIGQLEKGKLESSGVKSASKSPKKKRKKENSSSSSTSSSGSDSSSSGCSCKTNCSCSSSSSSGSSSDSESSSSDDEETPKKSKAEREPEFSTKSNDAIDVVATDDLGIKNQAEIVYESDLETDETDTDEDFYDEHPQKKANQMLSEKRRQLLLQSNGDYDGIIENSRPSTPSLPPEEMSLKKRLKIKKRKKDRKTSGSPMKKAHQIPGVTPVNPLLSQIHANYYNQQYVPTTPITPHEISFRNTSTPIPSMEMHQEAEIRHLLHTHQHTQPVLPIIKQMEEQKRAAESSRPTGLSSATSSRKNSESSEPIKRSQRKRIPNKFYGYTSDDENQNSLVTTNPFKPVPPPNLTWRKEDLPSNNKNKNMDSGRSTGSASKNQASCWSLVPYQPSGFSSLTQTQMDQLPPQLNNQDYIQQYLQGQQHAPSPAVIEPLRIPNVPVHHINPVPVNMPERIDAYSDSSDEEPTLQINAEPRKRKRKQLTPAGAYPPPIPKLKLTIGNDNKIKRRNIKQKIPGAPIPKKRKAPAPKTQRPAKKPKMNASYGDASQYSQKSMFDDSFDSSFSLSQSLTMPSTSLIPPAQLLKSPNMDSQDFYYNQQQAVTQKQIEIHDQIQKQQKLEDAIQKTQQYYQQFNHQQIKPTNHQQREAKEGERLYCYCQSPYDETSEMIGCDGDSCQIEWFHFECVGILVAPKGKWYCPECQKQQVAYPGM